MTNRFTPRAREFQTKVEDREVPAVVWTPEEVVGPRPLVLVGHGGSGHKSAQLVLDVMEPLVAGHGYAVAAIDGPVHGSRRAVFDEGLGVRAEFRELWARGGSIGGMVADWRATLDELVRTGTVDTRAIGWYGISMGTAYGLPLVAAESRIGCAVLGMWGTSRGGSHQLSLDAPKVKVPVLFQRQSEDDSLTIEGQLELYDRLGSPDKQLAVYPGQHIDPAGKQLADIVAFLTAHLEP